MGAKVLLQSGYRFHRRRVRRLKGYAHDACAEERNVTHLLHARTGQRLQPSAHDVAYAAAESEFFWWNRRLVIPFGNV